MRTFVGVSFVLLILENIIPATNSWSVYPQKVLDPAPYLAPRPPFTQPLPLKMVPKIGRSVEQPVLKANPIKCAKTIQLTTTSKTTMKPENEAMKPSETFWSGYRAKSYNSPPIILRNYDMLNLMGNRYDSYIVPGYGNRYNKYGGYGADAFGLIGNGQNIYRAGSPGGWYSGWGNGRWGQYGSG